MRNLVASVVVVAAVADACALSSRASPPQLDHRLAPLHASLRLAAHRCAAAEPTARESAKSAELWLAVATELRVATCALAEGSARCDDGDTITTLSSSIPAVSLDAPHRDPLLSQVCWLCTDVTGALHEAPALRAVARFSLKRNGDLLARRDACERTLVELSLLIGTYAVLTARERDSLLASVRPLVRKLPTRQAGVSQTCVFCPLVTHTHFPTSLITRHPSLHLFPMSSVCRRFWFSVVASSLPGLAAWAGGGLPTQQSSRGSGGLRKRWPNSRRLESQASRQRRHAILITPKTTLEHPITPPTTPHSTPPQKFSWQDVLERHTDSFADRGHCKKAGPAAPAAGISTSGG